MRDIYELLLLYVSMTGVLPQNLQMLHKADVWATHRCDFISKVRSNAPSGPKQPFCLAENHQCSFHEQNG
jgi:hypothetical protein